MADGATIRFGKVVDVNDPNGTGRIRVRTEYDNPKPTNDDLPWCFPLLPKVFHVVPKVGEMVLVIAMAPGDFEQPNFFIGPIISQEDKLYEEEYDKAFKGLRTGYYEPDENPRNKKDVPPTLYPETHDICLEGRKDTGIQLKDEEVRIKAGVKVVSDGSVKNNTESPAFISLKYYPKNDPDTDGFKSTISLAADKINLLGTNTSDPETSNIPVTQNKDPEAEEKDNLISDSAMKSLLNKAHQVPYGDTLIEFLDLLRVALVKHVHPFPTMTPCTDENMNAVMGYPLEGMLSDNVRIN